MGASRFRKIIYDSILSKVRRSRTAALLRFLGGSRHQRAATPPYHCQSNLNAHNKYIGLVYVVCHQMPNSTGLEIGMGATRRDDLRLCVHKLELLACCVHIEHLYGLDDVTKYRHTWCIETNL